MKKMLLLLSLLVAFTACVTNDDKPPFNEPDPPNYEYTQEEKDAEILRIEEYIKQFDLKDIIKAESGLFYRIDEQGDGLFIEEGDTVIFHFKTTNLETNEVLGESNMENNNYGQSFNFDGLLPGVKEGLQLIQERGKITMLVPAHLAYGKYPVSFTGIEPETNLMFEMQLNIVLKP
ncbi:FKBP-type peptidyl-prolyl cis-trans isomerase [Aquimarina algiphila]|nr:FKBP-type peptidyl-prolyl cis-trans isomerase [Aquimarina algiphila]